MGCQRRKVELSTSMRHSNRLPLRSSPQPPSLPLSFRLVYSIEVTDLAHLAIAAAQAVAPPAHVVGSYAHPLGR